MIFVTVGSMFPFDRLIRSMDEMVGAGLIGEPIVAQIGDGKYEPKHMPFDRFLGKPDYDRRVHEASLLIAHAGAGTIAMALAQGKPLLVLPRLARHGEHVNDHQVATARKFEQLGHVLAAYDEREIADKLQALKAFVPRTRHADADALARRIGRFLDTLARER